MKATLFTLGSSLLIMTGIVPLVFSLSYQSKPDTSFFRYRLTDKLTLRYTDNTIQKLADQASYALSFLVGNRQITDTVQLGHRLSMSTAADCSVPVSSPLYSKEKKINNTIKGENYCIYKEQLFVLPFSQSDEATNSLHRNNTVIDVYRINGGGYEGSICIPDKERKKVRTVRIIDDFLIALYPNSLSIYSLEK